MLPCFSHVQLSVLVVDPSAVVEHSETYDDIVPQGEFGKVAENLSNQTKMKQPKEGQGATKKYGLRTYTREMHAHIIRWTQHELYYYYAPPYTTHDECYGIEMHHVFSEGVSLEELYTSLEN